MSYPWEQSIEKLFGEPLYDASDSACIAAAYKLKAPHIDKVVIQKVPSGTVGNRNDQWVVIVDKPAINIPDLEKWYLDNVGLTRNYNESK